MKPGTKPKPTALKLLEGNPGKRPLPMNEPKPAPTAPKCPSWLHKDAKKEWKRISTELERLGLLTQVDMAALAGYCEHSGSRKLEQTTEVPVTAPRSRRTKRRLGTRNGSWQIQRGRIPYADSSITVGRRIIRGLFTCRGLGDIDFQ